MAMVLASSTPAGRSASALPVHLKLDEDSGAGTFLGSVILMEDGVGKSPVVVTGAATTGRRISIVGSA